MNKYRKLIAGVVGMAAMILGPQFLGVTPGEELFGIGQETAVSTIVALLTAFGIWGFRNDSETDKVDDSN